jgi:hypothetical protein
MNSRIFFFKQILIGSAVIMLMIISITCQKDYDNPSGNNKVELSAITIDTISYFHSYITSQLKSTGNNKIGGHGFCWDTQPSPDITKEHTELGSISSSSSFSSVISNLQPNQKYYIRAFASIPSGSIYGPQAEFTTLKTGRPVVLTDSIINLSYTSVQCKGVIQSDSGLAVTTRGTYWSINPNPDIANNHTSDGPGKGTFKSSILGLTPNTTYYIRAYGTNASGTSYGVQKSFSTLILTLPVITTLNIINITDNSAMVGGNVTDGGGSVVAARGVCWSRSSNPTISNSYTSNGTGTGTFTSNLTNLIPNTIYHVRAYATNIIGTAYGDDASFTTDCVNTTVVANDVTLCNQLIPVQLLATPTGGTWSGSNVTSGGLYTPNGTGNFVLTYTYIANNGCSNSDLMTVSVIAPTSVSAGNDTLVCINSGNFQLSGKPSGGMWSGTNVTASGLFSPTNTGPFTLTYTGGTINCLTNDEKVVTVASLPVVDAGADKSICIDNGLLTLTGSPAGGKWSGTGITNSSTGVFDPLVSGANSFTITYTYIDPATKCSNTDNALITVLPIPTVAASDVTICNQPIPVQLSATPAGGIWSGTNVTSGGLYTPNGTGNFVLAYTYKATNGCSNSDQMTISVIAPTPVSAGNDTLVCVNSGSFQLSGKPTGGAWSGTNVTSAGIFSTGIIGPFTLTYNFGTGNCFTKDEKTVTVVARPVVNAGADQSVCINNGLLTLVGLPVGGGTWSGTGITDDTGGIFNPLVSGVGSFILTYTYTDSTTKCSNTASCIIKVINCKSSN